MSKENDEINEQRHAVELDIEALLAVHKDKPLVIKINNAVTGLEDADIKYDISPEAALSLAGYISLCTWSTKKSSKAADDEAEIMDSREMARAISYDAEFTHRERALASAYFQLGMVTNRLIIEYGFEDVVLGSLDTKHAQSRAGKQSRFSPYRELINIKVKEHCIDGKPVKKALNEIEAETGIRPSESIFHRWSKDFKDNQG